MPRPRKPIEQHEKDGTLDKRVHVGAKLPVEIPAMPPSLPPAAQAVWNRITVQLQRAGYVADIDGLMLEGLCLMAHLAQESFDEWREQGTTLKTLTKNGESTTRHPAVLNFLQAWDRVHKFAKEFGMTPCSRLTIKPGDVPSDDRESEIAKILQFKTG